MNVNQLRTIIPGILCHGTERITAHEINDVMHLTVTPEKNSVTQIYINASDNKLNVAVNFHEQHAQVHIFGLYQLSDKQCVDIQTQMNHFVPHCASEQLWRGVLNDESKAEFLGKIIVHPNAQKTDAKLSNKNLLLSRHAEVTAKPELEIYADDVKCSHGATVGCLDENALFYLRSRGIAEDAAREMLVQAFIDEVKTKSMEVEARDV